MLCYHKKYNGIRGLRLIHKLDELSHEGENLAIVLKLKSRLNMVPDRTVGFKMWPARLADNKVKK